MSFWKKGALLLNGDDSAVFGRAHKSSKRKVLEFMTQKLGSDPTSVIGYHIFVIRDVLYRAPHTE